jgi:hypothetical protein
MADILSALEGVITGGQTGADQAGWRAAKAVGIPTGGAMSKGFNAEEGPRPEFAAEFAACELDSEESWERTQRNVIDSEGTLWFGNPESEGGVRTFSACRAFGKPYRVVPIERLIVYPSNVAEWLLMRGIRVLNVAGNRQSTEPGIGARVEALLLQVFTLTRQGAHQ